MARRRTPMASPWLRDTDPDIGPGIDPGTPVADASSGASGVVLRTGPARPQPGVSAPPAARRLAVFTPHPDLRLPRVWVVGTHGGAGETTIAARLTDAVGTTHRWPRPSGQDAGHDGRQAGGVPVLLCARTHTGALATAQDAMRTWAAGQAGVDVVGIVFVPDAPGRLPRTLTDQVKVVAGGVPHAWVLTWSEDARLGLPARPDRAWRRFTSELDRSLTAVRTSAVDAPTATATDSDHPTTAGSAFASTSRPLGVRRAHAAAERSPR